MRTMALLASCAVLGIGVAFGGERAEKPAAFPRDVPPEFAPLREALASLKLTDQEIDKARPLAEKYRGVLSEEIEKAKNEVVAKLLADVRASLSDEHRGQFDTVLAATRKRDAAIAAADAQYAAALKDLRMLEFRGARAEKDIILRICESNNDLREKYKALRARIEKAKNDGIAQLPLPDPNSRNAKQAYNDAKDKMEKSAESQFLTETRDLLSEDQKVSLAKLVDALNQWGVAVQIAKDACKAEMDAVLRVKEPPKARERQRR